MVIERSLTAERLRELLHYESGTGKFTWRVNRCKVHAGDVAGSLNKSLGCVMISVDGRLYYASRLAWLYQIGEWPAHQIDHRDGNPNNNRWNNLRLATHAQNQWNRGKNHNNTTGFKGVTWQKQRGKFAAHITVDGKHHYLGLFRSPKLASLKYRLAALKHHGEFANAGG